LVLVETPTVEPDEDARLYERDCALSPK
jgi:hypothetical protein